MTNSDPFCYCYYYCHYFFRVSRQLEAALLYSASLFSALGIIHFQAVLLAFSFEPSILQGQGSVRYSINGLQLTVQNQIELIFNFFFKKSLWSILTVKIPKVDGWDGSMDWIFVALPAFESYPMDDIDRPYRLLRHYWNTQIISKMISDCN